jgi:hypothetical protein
MYIYYVYAYLREKDNTPYYIGKGKNRRAFSTQRFIKSPDVAFIVYFQVEDQTHYLLDRQEQLVYTSLHK